MHPAIIINDTFRSKMASAAIAIVSLVAYTDRLFQLDDVVTRRMLIAQVLFIQTGDLLLYTGESIAIVAWIAHALVAVQILVPFAICQ